MTQETADYLAALTEWFASEVKRVTGPSANDITGDDPGSSPPPPPPPPPPSGGG